MKTVKGSGSRSTGKYIFFLLPLLLIGCNSPEERPAEVLDPQSFSSVLIDIKIAEAILNQTVALHLDTSLEKREPYYAGIFEKHDINYQIFNQTFSYYQRKPEEFQRVYDLVLDSLNRLEMKVNSAVQKESAEKRIKVRQDSIP